MNIYTDLLTASPLFAGMAPQDIAALSGTLSAGIRKYKKQEFILHSGRPISGPGILLSGSADIIKEDFWGNRNILSKLRPGDIFAETYACLPGTLPTVSVVTDEVSEVLFLDIRPILASETPASPAHALLIRNLLTATARKNLLLNEKMTHLSRRTTREKLLSYLSAEAMRRAACESESRHARTPSCPAAEFDIPFNRQQLADYLSVDRSAMSAELCRMRDEGLLTFHKNHFTLL